jgi:hypothetical protein
MDNPATRLWGSTGGALAGEFAIQSRVSSSPGAVANTAAPPKPTGWVAWNLLYIAQPAASRRGIYTLLLLLPGRV